VLHEVLRRGLTRLTPYTVASPGRLAGQLEHIRATGLASESEEVRLGRASMATVVTDPAGAPVAAIGLTVAGPANPVRYVHELKSAAARVTFAG
jgi:DNA-binding IclR family transcriptional regulator